MKRNYGIPYMGSKNRIAKQIIDFLPSGETLVDLFGGGGAITDCASESGKWKNVIYNELDDLPYTCFLKALRGEYENETRWISREDFLRLKDTDEYVACCFSFGNNFKTYMYNEKIEPYKRAYHYAIVLDDFQPLSELFESDIVDKLKASVDGISDTKQRRLSFTKVLGEYIIGLLKEEKCDDDLKHSMQIDNNPRHIVENIERIERLDTLKKTVLIVNNKFPCSILQNQERNERLDTLKKTVQIINGKFPGQSLQSQERNERLNQMRHEKVDNITFYNDDYRNITLPKNSIIYCDIPYRNTVTYNKAEEFDYDAFYDWCTEKKEEGYIVFISEYSMPEDKFECVYELSKLSSLAATKSSRVTEKIFVPKNTFRTPINIMKKKQYKTTYQLI